jgi:hypothetical protein
MEAGARAREAESRGDDARAGEEWRRYRLIEDDLNGAGVRYVLIGGIALIRHGVVRATRDIDAVFDPDPDNVERIRALVDRWGATRPDGSTLADLVAMKRSVGRERDLVDLADLESAHGDLPDSRAST